MKPISENSAVSVSLMIAILGGAAYVTYAVFQGNANADAIKDLKSDQRIMIDLASDVRVIREKVEAIEKRLDKKGE